jgi:hypothetical protein
LLNGLTIKNKQKMKKKNLLMTAIAIFGLATITFGQTVPSYVPTNGLVGWWPFNGNANDESGNNHDGVVNSGSNGTLLYVNDRLGNSTSAIEFTSNPGWNQLGPHIELVNTQNILLNSEFTINYFVSMNSSNQVGEIINKGPDNTSGVFVSLIANGTLQNGITAGGSVNQSNFPSNTWKMVTVINSTTNQLSLFIDGALAQTSSTSPISSLTSNFYFGAMPSGGSNGSYYPFQGKLDDLGFWNRALTQQEITDLYNGCQTSVNTQPTNQTININTNAQFVVTSSDPSATYLWQTDLGVGYQNLNSVGQYSGTTNDTLTVSNVTMSNNNQPFRCIVSLGSCSDTSNVAVLTVNNNVGINENTQDNLFSVFPNPAQSVINVKTDSKLISSVYTIYDNTGRVVLTGKLNYQNTTIELGNLSGGMYLFSVGENMKQTFKVIKE